MRALAYSGGKDSTACLHLTQGEVDCAIFVDTGFNFPETLEMVKYAEKLVPFMHIVKSDRAGQNAREGIPADVVPIRFTRIGQEVTWKKPILVQDYLLCCAQNISAPLFKAAKELGVTELVIGERKEDGHKSTAKSGDVVDGITRIHPIESWNDKRVMQYLATKMDVPDHFYFKHSSLDCYDCTAYRGALQDRLWWFEEKYPELYKEYLVRRNDLNAALMSELSEVLREVAYG